MDKIDWIITVVVASIMLFCFWLGGPWAYFFAGVCATCLFFVNIGRLAYLYESKHRKEQWEEFIDSMATEVDNGKLVRENKKPYLIPDKYSNPVMA